MKKLLVHYVNNLVSEENIDVYKKSLTDELGDYDHIVTFTSGESRIECLNPVILSNDGEIKQIIVYLKSKLKLIKKGNIKK